MQVKQLKNLLIDYLNRSNVSYQLYTEHWFMEISIKLQNTTLRFAIEQRDTITDGLRYDMFVLEPSGFNKFKADISFDLNDDYNVLTCISEYLTKLALFLQQDNQRVVLKETSVVGSDHNVVYYNDFLGVLHAAGFIDTDYVETQTGDTKLVCVFVIPHKP